jgi:hypothetical protein
MAIIAIPKDMTITNATAILEHLKLTLFMQYWL